MNAAVKSLGIVVLGVAVTEAFAPAALFSPNPSVKIVRSAPSLRSTLRRPAATQLRAHVDPASAFHVVDTLQVMLLLMSVTIVSPQL